MFNDMTFQICIYKLNFGKCFFWNPDVRALIFGVQTERVCTEYKKGKTQPHNVSAKWLEQEKK